MASEVISQKLREARKRKGLSQQDLCKIFKVGQSTFSAWENGISEPDISRFLKLCEIYEISDILKYFTGKISTEDIISLPEEELLKKLRELPKDGYAAVENCLDFEYKRMIRAKLKSGSELRRIKVVLQPAAAGFGNYLSDVDSEEMTLLAPKDADIGVRISGNSMEPLISDGDIVFIKYRPTIDEGDIGIFCLNGEAYCKKLSFIDGIPCLVSLNSKYRPIIIGKEDRLITYGKVLL